MSKYRSKYIKDLDIKNIINLYDLGRSIEEIQYITNIDRNVIKKFLVMQYNDKIPITKEEIKYIRDLYKKCKIIPDISQKTGRTVSVIRYYLKDLITKENDKKDKEMMEKVLKIRSIIIPQDVIRIYLETGYDIKDIATYYNVNIDIIEKIIKDYIDKNITFESLFEKPFTKAKVKIFRDFFCKVGDKYNIINTSNGKNINIIIKIKSTHIVLTDKGSYQYKDIIFNGKKSNKD